MVEVSGAPLSIYPVDDGPAAPSEATEAADISLTSSDPSQGKSSDAAEALLILQMMYDAGQTVEYIESIARLVYYKSTLVRMQNTASAMRRYGIRVQACDVVSTVQSEARGGDHQYMLCCLPIVVEAESSHGSMPVAALLALYLRANDDDLPEDEERQIRSDGVEALLDTLDRILRTGGIDRPEEDEEEQDPGRQLVPGSASIGSGSLTVVGVGLARAAESTRLHWNRDGDRMWRSPGSSKPSSSSWAAATSLVLASPRRDGQQSGRRGSAPVSAKDSKSSTSTISSHLVDGMGADSHVDGGAVESAVAGGGAGLPGSAGDSAEGSSAAAISSNIGNDSTGIKVGAGSETSPKAEVEGVAGAGKGSSSNSNSSSSRHETDGKATIGKVDAGGVLLLLRAIDSDDVDGASSPILRADIVTTLSGAAASRACDAFYSYGAWSDGGDGAAGRDSLNAVETDRRSSAAAGRPALTGTGSDSLHATLARLSLPQDGADEGNGVMDDLDGMGEASGAEVSAAGGAAGVATAGYEAGGVAGSNLHGLGRGSRHEIDPWSGSSGESDASSLFSDASYGEKFAIEAAVIEDAVVAAVAASGLRQKGRSSSVGSAGGSTAEGGAGSVTGGVPRVPSTASIGSLLRLPGRARASSSSSREGKHSYANGPPQQSNGRATDQTSALRSNDEALKAPGTVSNEASDDGRSMLPGRRILRIKPHRARTGSGADGHDGGLDPESGAETAGPGAASERQGAHRDLEMDGVIEGFEDDDGLSSSRNRRKRQADRAEGDAVKSGGAAAGAGDSTGGGVASSKNAPGGRSESSETTLREGRARLLAFLRRLRVLARGSHEARVLVLAAAAVMAPRLLDLLYGSESYPGGAVAACAARSNAVVGQLSAESETSTNANFLASVRALVGAEELLLRAAQDRDAASQAACIAALRALGHAPADDALLWASQRAAEADSRIRAQILGQSSPARSSSGGSNSAYGGAGRHSKTLFVRGQRELGGLDEGVRFSGVVLRSPGIGSRLGSVPDPSVCWRPEDQEKHSKVRASPREAARSPQGGSAGAGAGAHGTAGSGGSRSAERLKRNGRPLYSDAYGATQTVRWDTNDEVSVEFSSGRSTLFLGAEDTSVVAGVGPGVLHGSGARAVLDRLREHYERQAQAGGYASRQAGARRVPSGAGAAGGGYEGMLEQDGQALARYFTSIGVDPGRELARMRLHALAEAERNRRRAATGALSEADSLRRAWVLPASGEWATSADSPGGLGAADETGTHEDPAGAAAGAGADTAATEQDSARDGASGPRTGIRASRGFTPSAARASRQSTAAIDGFQAELQRWLRVGATGELEEEGRVSIGRKDAVDAARLYEEVAAPL